MSDLTEFVPGSFWAKAFKWLATRLAQLAIITLILLASYWLSREWKKVKAANDTAVECRKVALRLEEGTKALQARKAELEIKLKDEAAKLTSAEERCKPLKVRLDAALSHLEGVRAAEHFWYTTFLNSDYYLRLKEAEIAYDASVLAFKLASKDLNDLKVELSASPLGKELTEVSEELDKKREDIQTLLNRAQQNQSFAAEHPLWRAWQAVLNVLPTALVILAGIILTPFAIKAFFYWVIAPLCSKAQPLVLIPGQGMGLKIGSSNISAPLTLEPGDKLLVHSRYLQAAGAGPGKSTKFLYSWKIPFTSIAAGLYALVQVHNKGERPAQVTVSPKSDLFDKLTTVEIPEGESLVIYPRSIAAIIQRGGTPPHISRLWKIFNIHSFSTFQFRYLVLHGSCEVVLRGCRGIRAEHLNADNNDRMQDLGSTLGFSPGVAYSTVRCEAFMDYILGRDHLFNDRFRGTEGVFLSDEIPDPRRSKGGIFGRGLEGVFDTILKGFGIC